MKKRILCFFLVLLSVPVFADPSTYFHQNSIGGILQGYFRFERRLKNRFAMNGGFSIGEIMLFNKDPYYGNAFFADILLEPRYYWASDKGDKWFGGLYGALSVLNVPYTDVGGTWGDDPYRLNFAFTYGLRVGYEFPRIGFNINEKSMRVTIEPSLGIQQSIFYDTTQYYFATWISCYVAMGLENTIVPRKPKPKAPPKKTHRLEPLPVISTNNTLTNSGLTNTTITNPQVDITNK